MSTKRILFVLRQAALGNLLAREAIDAILASAVFEQDIGVLFLGDSVTQLIAEQQGQLIDRKSPGKALGTFALYDINNIFIDQQALADRGLNDTALVLQGKLLKVDAMQTLLQSYDLVLNF